MPNPSALKSSFYIALYFLVGIGCDFYPRSNQYQHFDQSPNIPVGQFSPLPESPPKPSPNEDSPLSPDECKGTKALTPDGHCVVLNVRRFGNAERVQLPSGDLIYGQIPTAYDGSKQRRLHVARWPDQPLHKLSVDGFWIDVVEVTRTAYQSCVDRGDCTPAHCPDGSPAIPSEITELDKQNSLPQTCVSHQQAEQYCSQHEGRLPSAAEWEYAARGNEYRPYPWGDQLRDEVRMDLIPVGSQVDASFFAVLGLATSGFEWVADVFQADYALAQHVTGPYRNPKGPSLLAKKKFETQYFCGGKNICTISNSQKQRHVYKGVLVGHTMAAYKTPPRDPNIEYSLEGWKPIALSPSLGFRCASDLSRDDIPLHLSPSPLAIKWTISSESTECYVGTFEALSFSEANLACQRLDLKKSDDNATGRWRLPDLHEMNELGEKVAGPGPYWLKNGSAATYLSQDAVSQDAGANALQKQSVWKGINVEPNETLLVRCVRPL